MAPRAYWTGNLKISLVTFGVRLYSATTESEKIRLNQLHKDCNSRIRMPTTCPIHGQVDRSEIVKGYEFEKDKYVVVEQDELDKIKLRSEKTIELTKFVPVESIQDVYLDSTYYVAPDGPVSEEPFRVVREALDEAGAAGIGKLTLAGRERPVLVRPGGRGFALVTLHAANEVRDASPYFDEIKEGPINREYMDLATTLIRGKMGRFDPSEFRDRYQDALVELVKSKVAGQAPVIVQEEDLPATFNFAEALRQSLAHSDGVASEDGDASRGNGRRRQRGDEEGDRRSGREPEREQGRENEREPDRDARPTRRAPAATRAKKPPVKSQPAASSADTSKRTRRKQA
ncbi:MAG: Ku protein [Planctomycetota bacterium]|nr:Ku protein [Planctomycetota bacterium]